MGGSGVIPWWKLKREVLRFRQQLAWYGELTVAGRRTRQHDRDRKTLVRRNDGLQTLEDKIAAILIFQPGALPDSLLETCDLLADLGYAVLIVSNGPLTPEARTALLPRVWRVLERPNLGYDFGGYREAVMHLWDQGIDPEELLIMNDSVWVIAQAFPAFLTRISAMKADVAGTVLRSKKGKRWLESFFFQLRRPALTAPAFRNFWLGYRLIDSKFGVIRQGERDFTVALAAGGLRIAGLGDNPEFLGQMRQAPDEELSLAMTYAAPVIGALAEDRARLLADRTAPHWRTRVIAHLGTVLDGSRIWHSQFPVASQRVMGFPFIKKSREPVHFAWREQVLRAVQDGALPEASPQVMAEMVARQGEGAKLTPHWVSR
jgi:Rhamnan synthesis protein F